MQVRGAPLIGVTAAYGFALSMNCDNSDNSLDKCKNDLVNARPTAVNLSWAVNQVYDALIKSPLKERLSYVGSLPLILQIKMSRRISQ